MKIKCWGIDDCGEVEEISPDSTVYTDEGKYAQWSDVQTLINDNEEMKKLIHELHQAIYALDTGPIRFSPHIWNSMSKFSGIPYPDQTPDVVD